MGVVEHILTCVSSRDTSLVVQSSTTPEVPTRRSLRVRKQPEIKRLPSQVAMRSLGRGMIRKLIYLSILYFAGIDVSFILDVDVPLVLAF